MNQSFQTGQGLIDQHPQPLHHAKPFLGATDAVNSLEYLASWLPTRGNALFTLLIAGLLMMTQSVWSQPSATTSPTSTSTISYQGRLANSDGNPLTGVYNMEFRIYDVPTGGTPLWQEQWTGTHSVQVSDGLFNVMLGSLDNTLANAIAAHDELYLGITVGTDGEISPRVQLGSVPFSMQALSANFALDADTVDGLHASDLATKSYVDQQIAAVGAIRMLDEPLLATYSANNQPGVGPTTLDLNTLPGVTVPANATHVVISSYTASYTTANAGFFTKVGPDVNTLFAISAQNGYNSSNKVDRSLGVVRLTGTTVGYELLKPTNNGYTGFWILGFITSGH